MLPVPLNVYIKFNLTLSFVQDSYRSSQELLDFIQFHGVAVRKSALWTLEASYVAEAPTSCINTQNATSEDCRIDRITLLRYMKSHKKQNTEYSRSRKSKISNE